MAKNLDIHEAQTASPAYQQLVADATARVQTGQLAAFRAVNKELIQLYWDLGKMIAERQQANGWGNSVVELLAADLQKAFPSSSGFKNQHLADAGFLPCVSASGNSPTAGGRIAT